MRVGNDTWHLNCLPKSHGLLITSQNKFHGLLITSQHVGSVGHEHVKSSYTCCIAMFGGKTQRINLLRSWYQVCVYGYGIPPRTPTLKTQTPFTKDDGNKRKKRRLRRAGNTWNGSTCLKGRIVWHEMFLNYIVRRMCSLNS